MKTTEEILTERKGTHGAFIDNATFTQAVKDLMRSMPGWSKLTVVQREALDFDIAKTSRILSGSADHLDSWQDKQGYIQLAINELVANAPEAAPPVKCPSDYLLPGGYIPGVDWVKIEEPKFPVYKDKED